MEVLLKLIRESMKAVPAMRYAMAVVGVLAVGAIAKALSSSEGSVAVVVAIFVMLGMVLVLVFARLASTNTQSVGSAAIFMLWTAMAAFAASVVLMFSAVISGQPVAVARLIGLSTVLWQARVFNVDQSAELYANGEFMTKATYGDDVFIDISRAVQRGDNHLEIIVSNQIAAGGRYEGITYGLELRRDGRVFKTLKC